MLARPELDSAVARDSAGADVIVVAANGDGELPPHIAGWVERCISREPNSEPVVVALSDREPQADGPAIPICASLMRIANRRHARFISGGALAEGADDELPVQPVQGSPESLISTLQKMLPYSTTASHWHSGIND